MTEEELFDRAMDIAHRFKTFPYNITDNSMDTTEPKMYRYEIQLPEDVHWTLVGLGAANKMDYETYAEEVLLEYGSLAIARASEQLGKQAET